jgi:hypothetical protein
MTSRKKAKTTPPPAPRSHPPVPGVEIAAAPSPVRKGVCHVCGEAVAPISTEDLCWVCRRLKISAWRDSDTQAAAQE